MRHSSPVRRAAQRWWGPLLACVCVRLALPLVVLAASGHGLGILPAYEYEPLNGDAFGFYAATREFMASIARVPVLLLALAVLVVIAAFLTSWRTATVVPARRWVAMLLAAFALVLALCLVIREMKPPGAAVMGWPLVWALSMVPYRGLGLEPDPDVAFVFGFVLSLVALATATIATAYVGRYATRSRSVGLLAAGLFAVWPLLPRLVAGEQAWGNGQWNVDVGLALYTEPVSTALVVVGAALLLRPAGGPATLAGSGLALGYATFVKLTNGLIALALVPFLAARIGWRRTLPFLLGGLVSAPLVLVYWPKGYTGMFEGRISASTRPWGLDYVDEAWGRSTLFTPVLLVLLAPLLIAGVLSLRDRFVLAVLLAPIVTTVVVYSFYDVTYLHPRFFYVALPFVFVLEAAGACAVFRSLRRREVKASFGGDRSSQRGL